MQDFLTLWSGFLDSLSQFLLSPPIDGFVGCTILLFIASIVHRIILGRR